MYKLNIFSSVKSKTPITTTLTIQALKQYFEQLKPQGFDSADASESFALYDCGVNPQSRKKDAIISLSAIVLNIDEPLTFEEVVALAERLESKEKAYVLYSTFSSMDDAFRLRVILPLQSPVLISDYETNQYVLRAASLIGQPINKECLKLTQLHFLPSYRNGTGMELNGIPPIIGLSDNGWCDSDLPSLTTGKMKLISSRPTQDAKGSSGQGTAKQYEMIDKIITTLGSGINPIATEGLMYFYNGQIWIGMDDKDLTQAILVKVFSKTIDLQTATRLIDLMKNLYYLKTFPDSPWLGSVSMATPLIALADGTFDINGSRALDSHLNYLRSKMDYSFGNQSACPVWLAFLNSTFANDSDKKAKIAALQEFMGYLLIPDTRFAKMLWLHGQGSNGKSVINHIIRALLGAHNVSHVPIQKLSQRFAAHAMVGKLANINDELQANSGLPDEQIKQIVAGNPIQAERKGKDAYDFKPSARLVVAMNQYPRINDTSHGFFRRVLLIEFNNIVLQENQDPELTTKLIQEMSGIFSWALKGLQRLLDQRGFTAVPSSASGTAQLQQSCDPITQFVTEIIQKMPRDGTGKTTGKTVTGDLYKCYREYCLAKGYSPKNDAELGRGLKVHGIETAKSSGKRYYLVTLKTLVDAGVITDHHREPQQPFVRQVVLEEEPI
jgi:putative DNA primase/helicase